MKWSICSYFWTNPFLKAAKNFEINVLRHCLKAAFHSAFFERQETRTARVLHKLHKLSLFRCALWTQSSATKVENFLLCALSCTARSFFIELAREKKNVQFQCNFNVVKFHSENNICERFLYVSMEWEKRSVNKAHEPCAFLGVQKKLSGMRPLKIGEVNKPYFVCIFLRIDFGDISWCTLLFKKKFGV